MPSLRFGTSSLVLFVPFPLRDTSHFSSFVSPPGRYYVDRIVSSIDGMKVLLLDTETTQIISTVYSQVEEPENRVLCGGEEIGAGGEDRQATMRCLWHALGQWAEDFNEVILAMWTHAFASVHFCRATRFCREAWACGGSAASLPTVAGVFPAPLPVLLARYSSEVCLTSFHLCLDISRKHPLSPSQDHHPRAGSLPGGTPQSGDQARAYDALAGRVLPPSYG